MTALDLIREAAERRIDLIPNGSTLTVEGSTAPLSDDLRDALRRCKPDILRILTESADRELCFRAAAWHGHPRLAIRPGESIAGGADAWKRFAANACIIDVRAAMGELAGREIESAMVGNTTVEEATSRCEHRHTPPVRGGTALG